MKKLSSTNYGNQQSLHERCDAAYTLSLIGGRWKLTLLTQLGAGVDRFSLLRVAIPAITERVLALQLRELGAAGLIVKKTGHYELTGMGRSVIPLIDHLACWGKHHKAGFSEVSRMDRKLSSAPQ